MDALTPATSSGGWSACRQTRRRANWSPRRRFPRSRCHRAMSADSPTRNSSSARRSVPTSRSVPGPQRRTARARASWMGASWCAPLSAACARARRRRLQDVFLHKPRFDLAENDFVRIAAVEHVNDLESGWILPWLAELAEHASIELGLVDFAGVGPRSRWITVWIRIGEEHVLVRPRGNAQRPSGAEIGDFLDRLEIVVELLVPVVRPIRHPDVAALVDLQPVRQIELAERGARLLAAGLRDEAAVLVVLHDAIVAVAVGDEDVALRIPAHVRRSTQDVLLRRRIRAGWCDDRPVNGRRPAADHHQHFALRAELGHQVRAFVDGPDVVFLVDADRVGEL